MGLREELRNHLIGGSCDNSIRKHKREAICYYFMEEQPLLELVETL
jgi:hypothetical protein